MGLKQNKNQGFTLVVILIATVIILVLITVVYFKSGNDTKNIIETKQQAEVQVDDINQQINEYNQRIKEQEREALE